MGKAGENGKGEGRRGEGHGVEKLIEGLRESDEKSEGERWKYEHGSGRTEGV